MRATSIIAVLVITICGCSVEAVKFTQGTEDGAVADTPIDDANIDAPPDAPMACSSQADCTTPGACEDGPGSCTNNICVYPKKAANTVCRAASGNCDIEDKCDGVSSGCPDVVAASSVVCRASAGVCDVAETCNGTAKSCPGDGFQISTIVCRCRSPRHRRRRPKRGIPRSTWRRRLDSRC